MPTTRDDSPGWTPNPRMLDIAEQISTLLQAGVWTVDALPAIREIRRRLGGQHTVVRGALRVLVGRGLLPPPRQAEPATERVWALIQDGIESGRWGPGAFPTVQALAVEFRCAAMTASRALRLGEERGLVRKVVVLPPPPATKVVTRWRVVSRHDDPAPRPSAAHRLRSAIRTGEFTGALPTVAELARRLRVNNGTMSRACRELAGEGLLRRVWLPDFSRCVWYVIDGREPRWLPPGEGGKAVAIAADLARGLDRWCRRDESGRWVRRKLPPPYKLGRRYRTGWVEVNRALDLLVGRGLLERVVAPGGAVDHLPLPPRARPSAFGSGIPAVARRASTSWPTVRPRRRRVLV